MVKKLTKQYETPFEAWDGERIEKEKELIEEFGLANKREVYKAESELRGLRRQARKVAASEKEDQKKPLLEKAHRLGLIKADGEIVDILSLETRDILNRRLQSAVERKGFADTAKEARQRVVHGHIFIDGERVNVPGYLLTQEEEKEITLKMPEPEESEDNEETSEEVEEENSEEVEEGENE